MGPTVIHGLYNREDRPEPVRHRRRTVEGHLTHAYQKLAITSREQLPAVLTLASGGASARASC
jgi:hypothetical protein